MNSQLEKKIFSYFLAAAVSLSIYFLLYLPIEFLFTEVFFITPKISYWYSAIFLLFLLLIANLFDWESFLYNRRKLIYLLLIFLFSLGFNRFYLWEKLGREYLPKIYSVNPPWVIQGQLLEINGVNFGHPFERGKVLVDGTEFLIREWNEKQIITEAPVPNKFGNLGVVIETKRGKLSNKFNLEIKDPSQLRYFE